MTADSLLQFSTQALYFGVFVAVAARALRHRRRADVDTALFFGALALIIAQQWVTQVTGLRPGPVLGAIAGSLLMALPYLLLRLVDDFSDVPRAVMRFAEAGLLASAICLFVFPAPLPLWLVIPMVGYFFGLEVYCAARFVREASRAGGVTRRRMYAVAVGSGLLGLTILMAGFQAAAPALQPFWSVLSRLFGLASGAAYFIGFAPPTWLRRAWQEPELRAFLGRAASLPRLPDTRSILDALEEGAATSVGAPHASIGLWDENAQVLTFRSTRPDVTGSEVFEVPPGQMIAGRAFAAQRAIFSPDAARDDPANAGVYRAYGSRAVIAAPITAGEQRLGVLASYAPRAPIFADEDLELVQLLADQAAVILESRALIDEAARVRAREEATRLKDDFLSAAAHDLKGPLTTLVAQAQLLERRARRTPDAPADPRGIERIVREAIRLRDLVLELLDAARAEQGRLVGAREAVDLVAAAQETCARRPAHACRVEAAGPVVGAYDRPRIAQLLENLVENALKYSPEAQPVRVQVWQENGEARLAVSDRGIGIPPADLPHVFDRFYRAANVDDRRYAGMGLGLFICRGIAEQHGGRIWAESEAGRGSTFHVALPLTPGTTVASMNPAAASRLTGAPT